MSSSGPSNYTFGGRGEHLGYMANEDAPEKDGADDIQIVGGQFSSDPVEAARTIPQANLVKNQLGTSLRNVLVGMGISDDMTED